MKISDKFKNSEKGKNLPKPVRPWDLLKTSEPRATDEVASERLSICRECPELLKVTSQCKKWMPATDIDKAEDDASEDTSKHS